MKQIPVLILTFILIFGFSCSDDDTGDITSYSGTFGAAYLGAGQGTRFVLYAPTASAVSVAGTFNGFNNTANPMTAVGGGIWETTIASAAPGHAYKFYSTDFSGEWVTDPYGRSFTGDGFDNAIIINDNYSWNDSGWVRPPKESLVIYELHVKDFTRNDSQAGTTTYSGMINKIPYLTALGVNAVELMPVQDWTGIGYSWGYNTACYFAPENAFGSDKNNGSAYTEFKQLVDALHQAGIAVILDVVYNHTFDDSPLWKIDPDGYYSTDSIPWGRKLDLVSPATRRYVVDNLVFLMTEFHIDGFRFDSTENIDNPTLLGIVSDLVTAGFGNRYFIFEEFDGDHNYAIQRYNTTVGKSVISSWGTGYKNATWSALTATSSDLGKITYYSKDDGWNYPGSVINYFSSHDEGTLTAKGHSKASIRTAATHLLTSMGIPMIWMGEEVCSTQAGNNVTNSTAEVNNIVEWDTLRTANSDLVGFFSGMIKLRVAHPALRQPVADPGNPSINTFAWNMSDSDWGAGNRLAYAYKNVSGDNDFLVLVNYGSTPVTFTNTLPRTGHWYLMSDGVTATNLAPGLAVSNFLSSPAVITVGPTSALVFMSSNANP